MKIECLKQKKQTWGTAKKQDIAYLISGDANSCFCLNVVTP